MSELLAANSELGCGIQAPGNARLYLEAMERFRISRMVVVCVREPIRKLAGGRLEHELDGATVIALLQEFELRYPAVSGWILDERGVIRRHINVFVNGERGDEATAVRSGDRVELVPAITGG